MAKKTNIDVNKMRGWLSGLARRRSDRKITADDVHTYLDRQGVSKKNVRVRQSYISTVLREPTFTPVGYRASGRPSAKNRLITLWTV